MRLTLLLISTLGLVSALPADRGNPKGGSKGTGKPPTKGQTPPPDDVDDDQGTALVQTAQSAPLTSGYEPEQGLHVREITVPNLKNLTQAAKPDSSTKSAEPDSDEVPDPDDTPATTAAAASRPSSTSSSKPKDSSDSGSSSSKGSSSSDDKNTLALISSLFGVIPKGVNGIIGAERKGLSGGASVGKGIASGIYSGVKGMAAKAQQWEAQAARAGLLSAPIMPGPDGQLWVPVQVPQGVPVSAYGIYPGAGVPTAEQLQQAQQGQQGPQPSMPEQAPNDEQASSGQRGPGSSFNSLPFGGFVAGIAKGITQGVRQGFQNGLSATYDPHFQPYGPSGFAGYPPDFQQFQQPQQFGQLPPQYAVAGAQQSSVNQGQDVGAELVQLLKNIPPEALDQLVAKAKETGTTGKGGVAAPTTPESAATIGKLPSGYVYVPVPVQALTGGAGLNGFAAGAPYLVPGKGKTH